MQVLIKPVFGAEESTGGDVNGIGAQASNDIGIVPIVVIVRNVDVLIEVEGVLDFITVGIVQHPDVGRGDVPLEKVRRPVNVAGIAGKSGVYGSGVFIDQGVDLAAVVIDDLSVVCPGTSQAGEAEILRTIGIRLLQDEVTFIIDPFFSDLTAFFT